MKRVCIVQDRNVNKVYFVFDLGKFLFALKKKNPIHLLRPKASGKKNIFFFYCSQYFISQNDSGKYVGFIILVIIYYSGHCPIHVLQK